MIKTIYCKATGTILKTVSGPDALLDLQFDESIEAAIDGHYSGEHFMVIDGTAMPLPPRPSSYHAFDYVDRGWVVTSEAAAIQIADARAAMSAAVQSHLDNTAQASGYDSILSACTYADESSVSRFQEEGRAFRAWRSEVWRYCWSVDAAVDAKTRPAPTPAELIAELPLFVIP